MSLFRTAALGGRALAAVRRQTAGYTCSRNIAAYIQGQSPEPRIREYFYYIDHQGQVSVNTPFAVCVFLRQL